jgi:hypothetical protein
MLLLNDRDWGANRASLLRTNIGLIHVNITAGDLDYLRALAGLGDERCACS